MNAFQLPRMSIEAVSQKMKREALIEMLCSDTIISLYQAKKGEGRFLFTGLGENEFILLIHLMHRHIEVFNLFETALETIKKLRNDDSDAMEFLHRACKYLHLKNQ